MQKKRATALKQEWGDRPCQHTTLAKEYDMGERTGSYVCTQCGSTLSFREKAERTAKTGSAASTHQGDSMKKSSRQIPDFSRHSSRPKASGAPGTPGAPPPAKGKVVKSTPPRPKPQATSGKSGQRGK